jgi:hypothetical protein
LFTFHSGCFGTFCHSERSEESLQHLRPCHYGCFIALSVILNAVKNPFNIYAPATLAALAPSVILNAVKNPFNIYAPATLAALAPSVILNAVKNPFNIYAPATMAALSHFLSF